MQADRRRTINEFSKAEDQYCIAERKRVVRYGTFGHTRGLDEIVYLLKWKGSVSVTLFLLFSVLHL